MALTLKKNKMEKKETKLRKAEYYKKRLDKIKVVLKQDHKNWINALNNMREIREEEAQKYEAEIGRLNQLIGIMKTGRIRYESQIAQDVVSGVLFLQEIQQVEVRPDHVLIVTNSGREIALGKAYDYLKDIFSIK